MLSPFSLPLLCFLVSNFLLYSSFYDRSCIWTFISLTKVIVFVVVCVIHNLRIPNNNSNKKKNKLKTIRLPDQAIKMRNQNTQSIQFILIRSKASAAASNMQATINFNQNRACLVDPESRE